MYLLNLPLAETKGASKLKSWRGIAERSTKEPQQE